MLTVSAIGRVTKDLEVQYSSKRASEPYIRFNFVVNKGYGEKEHPVFLQCWAFGGAVERLVKAKVGKGSLLHITADLDITKFKKDGEDKEYTIPKAIILDWGYVSVGKPKSNDDSQPAADGASESTASLSDFEEIDCNEDELPF